MSCLFLYLHYVWLRNLHSSDYELLHCPFQTYPQGTWTFPWLAVSCEEAMEFYPGQCLCSRRLYQVFLSPNFCYPQCSCTNCSLTMQMIESRASDLLICDQRWHGWAKCSFCACEHLICLDRSSYLRWPYRLACKSNLAPLRHSYSWQLQTNSSASACQAG